MCCGRFLVVLSCAMEGFLLFFHVLWRVYHVLWMVSCYFIMFYGGFLVIFHLLWRVSWFVICCGEFLVVLSCGVEGLSLFYHVLWMVSCYLSCAMEGFPLFYHVFCHV